MPGGDRTGSSGMGPMTGRAAGYCAGYPAPGYANPWPGCGWGRGFGRGWGRGWGRGRGRGWWRGWAYPAFVQHPFYYPASADDELRMLRDELKYAEENMKAMRKRIAELEKEAKNK